MAAEVPDGDPFFVVDLSAVLRKLQEWRELLPRVKPFYAIKCNPDPYICRLLKAGGCGFDCASQAEIQQVLDMGCSPEQIIYANPCKQPSMLKYVREQNVPLMTADNHPELNKIAKLYPEARVVLRIAVDDSKSVCRFNSKFGASEESWEPLLQHAKDLGLDMVGVSFHVGSGCSDTGPYRDAIAAARRVFAMGTDMGFNMTLLDLGGGWPGSDTGSYAFADAAATVMEALDIHFPVGCGVDVMAEPGRYMCTDSHSYAVQVIAKRDLTAAQLADAAAIETFGAQGEDSHTDTTSDESDLSNDGGHDHVSGAREDPDVALYINDGVYGSFNCVVFDHAEIEPKPLFVPQDARSVKTKLFGPTCDSIDVVMPCARLPNLTVGDWLYFENMGAYTRCAATRFNGQGGFSVHYVWEEGKEVAELF
jgi:ornithine decarboxylase